jgi:hypothetical protein
MGTQGKEQAEASTTVTGPPRAGNRTSLRVRLGTGSSCGCGSRALTSMVRPARHRVTGSRRRTQGSAHRLKLVGPRIDQPEGRRCRCP